MIFKRESGAIIGVDGQPLALIEGSEGAVEFPEELIWTLHKLSPGCINRLTHVHPTGMSQLSQRDLTTLKTWAFALYPFPPRLATIVEEFVEDEDVLVERVYTGFLEPKETWKASERKERRFDVVLTGKNYYKFNNNSVNWTKSWIEWMRDQSYVQYGQGS